MDNQEAVSATYWKGVAQAKESTLDLQATEFKQRESRWLGRIAELEADIRLAIRQVEVAESVAQMAAHDRDEALENFARAEQLCGRLAKLIDCAWSAQCGQCLNAAHAMLEN